MPLNRNALMRMRTIDSCLRRRQRLWTIEDLREACEDALYDYEGISYISDRTIRRDLQLMRSDKLGFCAPIVVKNKKYYTYEDPDYSISHPPLSKADMAELSSALDIIRHYSSFKGMAGQEDIITRLQDTVETLDSHQRVVYIETNNQLKGLSFLGVLYDFIMNRTPVEIDYQPFKSKRQTTYWVSPYILKEFNNRWFLLAYDPIRKMVLTIAIDRIVEIRKDKEHAYVPNTFFNPEIYLDEMIGITRTLQDVASEVELRVDAETTPYIITKPLHSSQQVVKTEDDGSTIICLKLILNLELERLLLGFGCHVEVLSPASLRQHIAAHARAAMKMYAAD